MKNKLREFFQKPLLVFIVFCLAFGIISVFIEPPMAVNDEITHFSRAYEISHGVFLTKRLPDKNLGGLVPSAFIQLNNANTYTHDQKPLTSVIKKSIKSASKVSINTKDKIMTGYSNTALYSPISYVPQALTILFSRALNLSVLSTFYLTRIIVLLCFMFVTALAIFVTPAKKWFFAIIGLLPMTIQEAASVSVDGLLISFCLLFLACFLYVYKTKSFKIAVKDHSINVIPLLFIAIFYISLSKFVYFPLFLILLVLPKEVFKSPKEKIIILSTLILLPFIILVAWNGLLMNHGASEAQRASVSGVGIYPPTLKQGLSNLVHPQYTAVTIIHTYINQPTQQIIPDYITDGFFGRFTSYFIMTPSWYDLTVFVTILLALFMEDTIKLVFSPKLRILTVTILAFIFVLITMSMFFDTTTAGQEFINGIQGRYFIPLLGFVLLLLGNKPILRVLSTLKTKAILMGLVFFNLCYMQLLIFQWFWRP